MIEFDLNVNETGRIIEFDRIYNFSLKKGEITIVVKTKLQDKKNMSITSPEEIDIQIESEFKRLKKNINDDLIRKLSDKIIDDLVENEIEFDVDSF